MDFAEYHIGQNFLEIADSVTEISDTEYGVLKPSFKDEKIYHAKETEYCETTWKTIIGVTQGKVYKISLQTTEIQTTEIQTTEIQTTIDIISKKGLWHKVYHKFNDDIGTFTDQESIGYSFITTWDTTWGNVILNKTILPNEKIFSEKSEILLDITATGNFAFKQFKKEQQLGLWILIIAGLIISHFVPDIIAFTIFIILGVTIGRDIDKFLGKLFLKAILKKGFVFSLSLIWGTSIALWIRELTLHYQPNIILTIIGYASTLYIAEIFYKDTKVNAKANLLYGTNIKTTLNAITITTNIIASFIFYFIFK